MTKSRFQIAKKDIKEHFDNNNKCVYTENDISIILKKYRRFWRLSVSLSTLKFIDLLIKHTSLQNHYFDFPKKRTARYSWGDVSIYNLAVSLERNAYLSHYSALFTNDLTDQIPKKIYITYEQPEKYNSTSNLSQSAIDLAFSKPVRVSQNVAVFHDYSICALNGKYTDRLGVIETQTSENETVLVTDIERTLIDIAVRPVYSGGIYEVLSAFKKAAEKVSVNKLSAMLQKLNFVYPHHQVIGFYLTKSGVYRETQINLLKKCEFKFKFYLNHDMRDVEFSKEWGLYYPKGF